MSGYTAGRRDAIQAFAADRDLLLWLHAEAAWHRDQLDAEALKWTEVAGRHAEELDEGRVAYLEARVGELNETVGRLRARIHEAVDETQRRYAKYQSRCASFDTWSKWAREHAERAGDLFWTHTSQAHRLYVMSLHQDIERLRREVEFEANGADTFSGADVLAEQVGGSR